MNWQVVYTTDTFEAVGPCVSDANGNRLDILSIVRLLCPVRAQNQITNESKDFPILTKAVLAEIGSKGDVTIEILSEDHSPANWHAQLKPSKLLSVRDRSEAKFVQDHA